jgi:hypothetical protein
MMMVKATKFFRKQADKAERIARATTDEEVAQNLSNLALAYRSQADALKKGKKKAGKKDKPKANKQKKKRDKPKAKKQNKKNK